MRSIQDLIKTEVHTLANEVVQRLYEIDRDFYYEQFSNIWDKENPENSQEIMQYWIVTDWFAEKMIEQGEPATKDFYGLAVWGRTGCDQAIEADGPVVRMYEKLKMS